MADGDARIALNSLQMAVNSRKNSVKITLDDIKDSIKVLNVRAVFWL